MGRAYAPLTARFRQDRKSASEMSLLKNRRLGEARFGCFRCSAFSRFSQREPAQPDAVDSAATLAGLGAAALFAQRGAAQGFCALQFFTVHALADQEHTEMAREARPPSTPRPSASRRLCAKPLPTWCALRSPSSKALTKHSQSLSVDRIPDHPAICLAFAPFPQRPRSRRFSPD